MVNPAVGPQNDPKLMTQKEIAAEYGVPTRDILISLQKGRNFPKPVQVLGRKRWFRREDIVRYFKDSAAADQSPPA